MPISSLGLCGRSQKWHSEKIVIYETYCKCPRIPNGTNGLSFSSVLVVLEDKIIICGIFGHLGTFLGISNRKVRFF